MGWEGEEGGALSYVFYVSGRLWGNFGGPRFPCLKGLGGSAKERTSRETLGGGEGAGPELI